MYLIARSPAFSMGWKMGIRSRVTRWISFLTYLINSSLKYSRVRSSGNFSCSAKAASSSSFKGIRSSSDTSRPSVLSVVDWEPDSSSLSSILSLSTCSSVAVLEASSSTSSSTFSSSNVSVSIVCCSSASDIAGSSAVSSGACSIFCFPTKAAPAESEASASFSFICCCNFCNSSLRASCSCCIFIISSSNSSLNSGCSSRISFISLSIDKHCFAAAM
mmetsp:Transcript_32162/g.78145  ORF Transcript_32162/g.78145 Transcript_32162/m.78145 type:complete len:218 (+) Transcript_32162:741-1394(+)